MQHNLDELLYQPMSEEERRCDCGGIEIFSYDLKIYVKNLR